MSEVRRLPVQTKRPQAGELAKRIHDLVMEYTGDIGLSEAVGALECVKFGLMSGNLHDIVAEE
ncbi:hypothetical protein AUM46_04245 [Cronobacter malonaticus]|uniref:Uncharacterized protein n=1 Tax=Cronobacter malonaticus TaxID=413503 RepID=A0ABX5K5E3_9ENTR|nr:hypothetical protein AUN13_15835 [Cronobacter malonaticus]PUX09633.1 hypothetical protein AUM46_04245 [Cronobacter malonaticus]